ncbi:MAG: hypothetical protein AAFY08_16670, partial [Planctomycetota bacterium]
MKRSLPLRTALHHDPTLASPLERLLELYQQADRLEELVGVYRTHLRGYPRDRSARTVLVRLLLASGDGEAERELRRAQSRRGSVGLRVEERREVGANDRPVGQGLHAWPTRERRLDAGEAFRRPGGEGLQRGRKGAGEVLMVQRLEDGEAEQVLPDGPE